MPVQAGLTVTKALVGLNPWVQGLLLIGAGAIDAMIIGALLAPDDPTAEAGRRSGPNGKDQV